MSENPTEDTGLVSSGPEEKKATELVADLESASREEAQAILDAEQARETPRVTVVRAAEERLAILDVPGEPQEESPEGRAWAQLLDADGEPVTIDGTPVEADITPASETPSGDLGEPEPAQ